MAHPVNEVWTHQPAKVLHDLGRKLRKQPVTAIIAVNAIKFEASSVSSRFVSLFQNRYPRAPSLHQPESRAYAGRTGSQNHYLWASGKICLFLHHKVPVFHLIDNDIESVDHGAQHIRQFRDVPRG